ncbi:MAG: AarF/ABC1/UbiB kinase family protein [Azospirillum sp.]|nr:AarF/ABC1/UbiB kinase family protein [Azospirillum sp.]
MAGESNSLGGRLARYARVGSAMGGLAVRLGAERVLGVEMDRAKHAAELRAALGGLKGPLMKVAQLIATVPDAIPEEYVQELLQLQSDAPAMGWPFVKRRMASELGPDWQDRFAEFPHAATAAASLGQVHRARLRDGRVVACKLQYPDMASAVEADLKQLKLAFGVYERYDRAIRTDRIFAEISARLREELDYGREAAHMRLYAHLLRDEPSVHVPDSLPELGTARLLTMTWLDGAKLLTVTPREREFRNTVARAMFRAWYVPFYSGGVIHGDPHLGNYAVREDGTVNLLDFGCVRIFPAKFVGAVIDLYRAIRDDDRDLAVAAYETWGFVGLSNEMIDCLNGWARFVYGPVLEDRAKEVAETNSAVYGREVAEKVHKRLRELGGVAPPREFVLMDRAAIGLGSVFMHLKADINWYREFHGLIEGFSVQNLAKRQKSAIAKAGVPEAVG